MSEVDHPSLTSQDVLKLLGSMQTAVEATTSSAAPLLTKARNDDSSLETGSGLSLLLLRPQLLLSSLHNLVILLSLRLAASSTHVPNLESSTAATTSFASHQRDRVDIDGVEDFMDELSGDLTLSQEVFDKVRGMEGKLEYQIKKLIGLADAEEKRGREVVDDAEEDPLSFRPNPAAFVTTSSGKGASGSRSARENGAGEDGSKDVYRPPRIAAVPYEEPSSSRRDRRAPALLSEFAHTMDGAPVLESTTGLSVRPVQKDRHTNSLSAKRAAELERMDRFEEENMTRLVTTKREEKRRREDEAALAMGYGVGGTGRGKGRRQNGLEAELEGVLGDRRSKAMWDGVRKDLGKRESMLERGKKRGSAPAEVRAKKPRFEKDVKGLSKKTKRA